ncbi:MAG: transcriptional repressor [Dehalococcoidales bacterium]
MKNGKAPDLSGMRATSQRALILEVIRRGVGHLDADEIYRQARKKEPRLSLSTVYRSLQAFKKLGLVEEVHFDEDHHHYELKQPPEHHHLVCLGCGRVIEFQHPVSRYVRRNVAEAKDFEIVDTELRMTGYCSRCRRERN